MCGFSGFVNDGAQPLDQAKRLRILRAMGESIAHRGPDDEQFYDDGVLSLVYRRLSIVDPAGGQQPIYNEDRSKLLVCNGEIYNHGEVRKALAVNHQFTTQSDSEVLLHGFEQWGTDVLQRVRGMFAFATWDRAQRRLFLARDRMGIKPMYVCHLPHGLLFGSELKALLAHPDCPRDMDWHNLHAHPMANAATPSYVNGIDHLPGATYLQWEPGRKAQIKPYWDLGASFNSAPFGLDPRKYVKAFDSLLEEAVAEHLQGEAAIGLHLSGGVDSSLIAAVAKPLDPQMNAFTIVERSNHLAGDTTAAADVAKALGMPWHPVLFDYRSYLQDAHFGLHTLEQAVWMMDSPLFDIEWIFKRELNRVIRARHPAIKVLLLGQGADEFCGGYSTRIDAPYANWNHYLNDEVRQFLNIGSATDSVHGGHHSVLMNKRSKPTTASPYQQLMLLMPRQLQHHNLWHEDRTSASLGMEARVPFLDHRIVELFASVPVALHKQLFWKKRIVRQALQRRLPQYNVDRPKVGFCWTDDTRSMDIIIHNMACQATDAFRDKYLGDKDLPFDRAHCEKLMARVKTRQPGFHAASVELLGLMSAALFQNQVRHASAVATSAALQQSVSRIDTLSPADLETVVQQFDASPVTAFAWQTEHQPRIPVGCSIAIRTKAKGPQRYELVEGNTVHATIFFPGDAKWIQAFIQGLAQPHDPPRSVGEWLTQMEVPQEQLLEVLNAMLQCGFVAVPEPVKASRVLRHMPWLAQNRLLPMQWLRGLRSRLEVGHWLAWLSRRRQQLEDQLHK